MKLFKVVHCKSRNTRPSANLKGKLTWLIEAREAAPIYTSWGWHISRVCIAERPGNGWRHEITSVLFLQRDLLHMFLPWDHHGAFVWGAVLSHQTKWVSVAALSTQSHEGPSHGCSSTQECIQAGAGIKASCLCWKWEPGQRTEHSCGAARPGSVLMGEGGGELSTAGGCGLRFCSKLHVFACVSFHVKFCLYVFNLL